MRVKGYITLFAITLFIAMLYYSIVSIVDRPSWKYLAVRSDSLLHIKSVPAQKPKMIDTSYAKRRSRKEQKLKQSIELNSADSATLTQIYGIGPTFAQRIIEYRQALGGFYSLSQLREIKGLDKLDEQLFYKITQNFTLDTSCILKININFASQNTLKSHPYISANMARRIARATQLKGGYINTRQLINQDIITPPEARKIEPYLSF